MEYLGNKLIEINVIDSGVVATPDTGSGDSVSNIVAEGLFSSNIFLVNILIALFIAVIIYLVAVVLIKLYRKEKKGFRLSRFNKVSSRIIMIFTSAFVALAVVISPMLNVMATGGYIALNNSPIAIIVDKAKVLSASDVTTLSIGIDDDNPVPQVDLYAKLDTTFNNNLGTNLTVSTANVGHTGPMFELSTTEAFIYTTGPVVTGDTIDFDVKVSVTEELPVGTYEGQIDFYRQIVAQQPITVTYWCEAEEGLDESNIGDDMIYQGDYDGRDWIGKNLTYDMNEIFAFPAPEEIGLLDCGYYDSSEVENFFWVNRERYNQDETFQYWPSGVLKGQPYGNEYKNLGHVMTVPEQFTNDQPDASTQSWFDECWLNYSNNESDCLANDDYQDWVTNIYEPWINSYWLSWDNWSNSYRDNHNDTPVFDKVEFQWTRIII